MTSLHRRAPDLLAALFGVSSIVHLVRPSTFEPLIPRWLPHPRGIVYASGVAEGYCALSLARRSRSAGVSSAALLVAVFPGNIQMAMSSLTEDQGRLTAKKVLAFGRLPLQLLLIWAGLQASTSPALSGRARLKRHHQAMQSQPVSLG